MILGMAFATGFNFYPSSDFSDLAAVSIKLFTVMAFPAILLLLFTIREPPVCFEVTRVSLYTTGLPDGSFDFLF